MQPETAFWALSSIAQSSAALAGLTALLLVFVLSEVRREFSVPMDVGMSHILRAIPLFRVLSLGTVSFLLAVVVSLITLGAVIPGSAPVGLGVEVAIYLSISLLVAGSGALVVFILRPKRWVGNLRTTEARKEWIDSLNK